MLYLYIWLFPILAGILAWRFKNKSLNSALVFAHSILHLFAGIAFVLPSSGLPEFLGIDGLSIWFFIISAILYFAVGLYSLQLKGSLSNRQSSIYAICMMAFVASMDGANLSRDLGLIWVFVETTTLASALLISFEHHKQSLEAAWKYLFICSIGIAMAFVGILLLVIAMPTASSLAIDTILTLAETITPFWLKVSFVFMLIGFGTKVGLAPLHFWLPDAHSEAPAAVSALLSGALLNTALLPLIRMQEVMNACHLGGLASQLFITMGLISMFVAAVFMLKIKNYKRMLAYSSIENMGIVMIAFALGEYAGKAGLIHVMGHSMIKAAFFLTAGNVYGIFGKKDYDQCSGLLAKNPISGWLWLISFMFIIGMPPSPLFLSEFYIAFALIASGNIIVLIAFFILLAIIAYGLGCASLAITMGAGKARTKLPFSRYLPQIALLCCAVVLPLLLLYLVY
ncbi:MAG: hypothetical protein CVU50_05040 [Candidatus Cloacimonetes bacterium HGW-Cloacimonetes-3]|jgi:hydrogenase-4 component F|nr:MAG: hypothetical protein CVU50_05040 [Candidatus Cloacimonetes bacterium HGW-Cloacimonetes-3]